MIPELGHLALILALCLAIILAIVPLVGSYIRDAGWMGYSRPLAAGQFALTLLSFLCLTWAFIANDFSVAYVANHSNSLLPIYYRISAVWGGHEGSLLLWVLILTAWTFAVGMFSRQLPLDMVARVLSVMGMISVGFMIFVLMTSNPFDRYLPHSPMDGADLNPLLQDVGLILHPPMLYMGYVGFSVAFAFAIAALMGGRLDAAWARWSRPWTTVAWCFLTMGIALGSWWAYYELGWGGWWFWDPVENASFMPWLAGTALMHSLAVTEKRGIFKSWTVLLAIFVFSLSLLGTFLVRSGVLTSVHAFASDPTRGRFVLGLLGITVGASLLLYAFRAPTVSGRVSYKFWSREVFLLFNNILLLVATVTVLLGTLYPLAMDALDLGKLSVGPPYFNKIFVPLTAILSGLLGIGIFTRWKSTDPKVLLRELWLAAALSLVLALALPFLFGEFRFQVFLGLLMALWISLATFRDLWKKIQRKAGVGAGLRQLSRSYVGMVLGHLGLAISIVGICLVSNYNVERDMRMAPGDTVTMGGYQFHLKEIRHVEGPNYISDQAYVEVLDDDGDLVTVLLPEKRNYVVTRSVMTEAGISAGLFRDLYVAMGEALDDGAWAVRIHYKPFVRWIWLGAIFMSVGGVIAIMDRRYRLKVKSGLKPQAQKQALDNEPVSAEPTKAG